MRIRACASGLMLLATACVSDTGSNTTVDPTAYTGSWTGGQSDRSVLTGTITFHVTSGVLSGDVSPISGSLRTLAGTVSATGAITATLPTGLNGCSVSFAGQMPATTSGTATGTYTLSQSSTCNTNTGSWTATRP